MDSGGLYEAIRGFVVCATLILGPLFIVGYVWAALLMARHFGWLQKTTVGRITFRVLSAMSFLYACIMLGAGLWLYFLRPTDRLIAVNPLEYIFTGLVFGAFGHFFWQREKARQAALADGE